MTEMTDGKKALLNLISDVKARLDGKVDSLAFPIPQFIVIGKQSVGKSRLIEGIAGEPFNFVSGSLGSRRPTVMEFRNVPGLTPSKWYMRDEQNRWQPKNIKEVMETVGKAHESLGNSVSEVPVRIKVEGADCVDLGLVDLPGFRSYAKDEAMKELSKNIEKMVLKFMQDENNVMICVEEAGDAAGFATLARCRELDPSYRRTILVRNKLDKYYNDLTNENVNKWLDGFGDLPQSLDRFAMSLPHWPGAEMPEPFGKMRGTCSDKDVSQLQSKGAAPMYMKTIGFDHFRQFIEAKIQSLFAEALTPLLTRLKTLNTELKDRLEVIVVEQETINEDNILHSTRSAGITFAKSFVFLMEGALSSQTHRRTMESELRCFHKHCDAQENPIPLENRTIPACGDLDGYIEYLRDGVRLQGMDVELNGGAQFRRLMYEVEVFTRFADLGEKVDEADVLQARGSGMKGSTSWSSVIITIMTKIAPKPIKQRTLYVGERLKWFFTEQKEATVQFMLQLKGSPEEHMFSRLIYQQATIIERNSTMKDCIFKAFDRACEQNNENFMKLWHDFEDSMFQSPLNLLKSCSPPRMDDDSYADEAAPTFDTTKERIQREREQRGRLHTMLEAEIKAIPDDDVNIGKSLEMLTAIVEKVFSAMRCIVADQMQLYSESFFLLPMLRRLEGEMATLELLDEDKRRYRARKEVLVEEKTQSTGIQADLEWSIAAIEKFKITCNDGGVAPVA